MLQFTLQRLLILKLPSNKFSSELTFQSIFAKKWCLLISSTPSEPIKTERLFYWSHFFKSLYLAFKLWSIKSNTHTLSIPCSEKFKTSHMIFYYNCFFQFNVKKLKHIEQNEILKCLPNWIKIMFNTILNLGTFSS